MSSDNKIIKKETLRHREAFEYYYSLGNDRNMKKVAEKFNVSVRAVNTWGMSFEWQERINQRDIEIGKKLEAKTVDLVVNEKAKYRKVIKLAMSKIIDSIQEGNMSYKIQDLDKLIRLDMFLLGENESNVKIENNHVLSEGDREAIEILGNNLNSLVTELGEL